VLIIEGLAPFDFTVRASSFDFWPFRIWFEGADSPISVIDWSALLGRLFLFTALLWLLREAAVPINAAIAIAVGAALTFEILQLWLPNQSGSITDPALVLVIGLAMRAMERARARRDSGYIISPPARSR
jgi:hypothetical protein